MTAKTLPILAAQTHPPRYRLHKYWSRKPHNVVRSFVEHLLEAPGVVVDPFVGSGVTAYEAAALGHRVHACDLNPIAVLMARTTASPPPAKACVDALGGLLDEVEADVDAFWRCQASGETIRYVVHAVVSPCPSCGVRQTAEEASGKGKSRRCKECGGSIRFNLESLVDTRVLSYALVRGDSLITERGLLDEQQKASSSGVKIAPGDPLLACLDENRRILAFSERSPADFFTPRALATLVGFRDRVLAIEDPSLRLSGLLLLTASAAQCSRLAADRNNLKTGGPAWSVPGFWVPPIHLETNPVLHLRARLRRFRTGLADAARHLQRAKEPEIRECDAVAYLDDLCSRGIEADLVILDPPYGDSVPFVEFSVFWNALLGRAVPPDGDISVTDRLSKTESWARYGSRIERLMAATASSLSSGGRVLVAFNNSDRRAWRALLGGAQSAKLSCVDVVYQFPAVVSSKAAFHPNGSYVGDIWAVFGNAPDDWEPSTDLAPAISALGRCAAFRDGVCATNLALRTLAMSWLTLNLRADLVDEWSNIIDSVFDRVDEHGLVWKEDPTADVPSMRFFVMEESRRALRYGPREWKDLYCEVADACRPYGVPDPAEVRMALGDNLVMNGNHVIALSTHVERSPQPHVARTLCLAPDEETRSRLRGLGAVIPPGECTPAGSTR